LPTSASARGEYNLLARDGFECVLDELLNDDGGLKGVGLVAHSPLGRKGSRLSGRAGSGKIQIRSGGSESERVITKLERQRGGSNSDAGRLVDAYEEVAGQFGMSLGELAMGFVRSRWFVTSVSVRGADCDELSSALASLYDAEVTADVLGELEAAALRLTLDEERVGRRRWSQEL
jgi:aryl-alcohol dehydrogenase-like predicted oxidoreductase